MSILKRIIAKLIEATSGFILSRVDLLTDEYDDTAYLRIPKILSQNRLFKALSFRSDKYADIVVDEHDIKSLYFDVNERGGAIYIYDCSSLSHSEFEDSLIEVQLCRKLFPQLVPVIVVDDALHIKLLSSNGFAFEYIPFKSGAMNDRVLRRERMERLALIYKPVQIISARDCMGLAKKLNLSLFARTELR